MAQPSLRQLERHIRSCAGDTSNIVWLPHSEQRMRQRKVTRAMALDVLRQGILSRPPEPEMRATGLRCSMTRFVAGIQVVVVVYVEHPAPDLTIVTVIDVNGD
ncbi:hypothetical protein [Ramlibacter sp.]|uniref:hypothetical protein n=1 Tax=Ramlibacter sp. TaxID=1917967 RepID=UPI003D101254